LKLTTYHPCFVSKQNLLLLEAEANLGGANLHSNQGLIGLFVIFSSKVFDHSPQLFGLICKIEECSSWKACFLNFLEVEIYSFLRFD
jgi:hypothetical protein